MKVFELAKKLNRTSKEILSASYQLQIKVESHLSNLTDDEVNKIIKYFRKKRILFFFKKYLTVFVGVFILTVIFTFMNSQTVASGQIYASVDEQGELTLDWSFESTVEEGVILVESESELLIIEVDENNGIITECCFLEDLEILLLFTDDDDDIVEVESVNISLPNTNISSTTTTILQTTSTSTSTTIAECNDDEFVPYTLYDSEGNANTVLTCRNEQDAIDSGYTYTTNPKPVTTTLAPTTTSTSTTTTLALLINQIPKPDKLMESSSCKKIKKGKNKGKFKFEYTAKFTSESKAHEYTFSYKINNKKWKKWSKGKFKPIGKKHLRIRVQKIITKPKSHINNFTYKFTYRPIGGGIETETDVFTVQENIPCTKTGVTKKVVPTTTTTTFNSGNSDIKFTDEVEVRATTTTLSPTTTLAPITTTTTVAPTTTTSTIFVPKYIVYDRDCNEFGPYPISEYEAMIGDGSVYLGYCIIDVYATSTTTTTTTTIPEPPPVATTTTTTTTTIPDPSSTVTQSLGSCSGPSGTRTSTLSVTNNESYTAFARLAKLGDKTCVNCLE